MPLPRPLLCLLALACLPSSTASSQTPPGSRNWVSTWAAAPAALLNPTGELFAQDTTLREIVHVSHGGHAFRIVLSNELSAQLQRLRIGSATIALSDGTGTVSPSDLKPLTFSGKTDLILAPQAQAVSDPVRLDVKPNSDLAISLFLPGQKIDAITYHKVAQQTNYSAPGDDTNMATLPNATPATEWYFLKGVEVDQPDAASIVCLGDSITDGFRSTVNANARWPNILSNRLQQSADKQEFSVVDLGIAGNRVLEPGIGPGALSRLDRDVLAQAQPRYLIILEGINDIGLGHRLEDPLAFPPTAEDLIAAYQQIITRAHAKHLVVYGATLLPYKGAKYFSETGEEVRETVNAWIRSSGAFDGVIDFDAVMRDPKEPLALNPAYRSDDHLHPNDQGYKVMGDSIPLRLFNKEGN